MYTVEKSLDEDRQIPVLCQTGIMDSISRQKPMASGANFGINGLIAACNKNDRFKLLEDDGVLSGNLDNPIHNIFSTLDYRGPMQQALQLASHFLAHDTLISFFVPLLYGRELIGIIDGTRKTYLSNPLNGVSTEKHQAYLSGVRSTLECLSHNLSIRFQAAEKRIYARTLLGVRRSVEQTSQGDEHPFHGPEWLKLFPHRYSSRIELADSFQNYYTSGDYAVASRCAQFRHDFLFATTLVHEIVHAVGVVRRGNLNEPFVRADCPESEWGYSWENFMFGCIMNPQDKTRPGTHLLVRKAWSDATLAAEAGGKEYSDVPMSYIAQWFRQETWDLVCEQGPTAIAPPIAHFKIQSSNQLEAWVVQSSHLEIKKDLTKLYSKWKEGERELKKMSNSSISLKRRMRASKIIWKFVSTEKLQRDNVPIPVRMPRSSWHSLSCFQYGLEGQSVHCKHPQKRPLFNKGESKMESTSFNSYTSQKRRAGSMEDQRQTKKYRKL